MREGNRKSVSNPSVVYCRHCGESDFNIAVTDRGLAITICHHCLTHVTEQDFVDARNRAAELEDEIILRL